LPFPEVIAQAKARRAVRLHDLEHEIDAPPQELRLILAVLVKHGYLEQKLDPESLPPTTQELRSTLGVELSAQALLQRARESGGVHSRLVTLHLLAETDVWPKLRGLFEAFREPPFDAFNVQLAEEQQGRLVLVTEEGQLALHLSRVDGRLTQEMEQTLSVSDGALLWLGEDPELALFGDLIERSRLRFHPFFGLIVPDGERARAWSEGAIEGLPQWTLGARPPTRVSTLLRYFFSQPAEKSPSPKSQAAGPRLEGGSGP
ncbi:MAG: hypothetical protein AAF725_17715, partial [Acidobacteriota bacterium]